MHFTSSYLSCCKILVSCTFWYGQYENKSTFMSVNIEQNLVTWLKNLTCFVNSWYQKCYLYSRVKICHYMSTCVCVWKIDWLMCVGFVCMCAMRKYVYLFPSKVFTKISKICTISENMRQKVSYWKLWGTQSKEPSHTCPVFSTFSLDTHSRPLAEAGYWARQI